MDRNWREVLFKAEQQKVAHEIVARRQRREAAGDDLIQRALFEKRITLRRATQGGYDTVAERQ